MDLWTSLIAGAVLLMLLLLLFGRINVGTRFPPGPPPLPVLGNLLNLSGKAPHQSLSLLSKRYGPIIYLRLGSVPAVVVSNASLAKEFLTACDRVFASRPPLQIARRLQYGLDTSLSLASYGPYWREMRKVCTLQLFTATRVREFERVRREEIQLMIKHLVDQAQQATHAVNIRVAIGNLTENIMGRILFSKRLCEIADAQSDTSLRGVIHDAGEIFLAPIVGDFIPYLGWLDNKTNRRMDELHNVFDIHLETLVTRRCESVPDRNLGDDPKDLLDVLLSNNLPRLNIKAMLEDLLGGGVLTTTTTLESSMAELLRNPRTLQKLQQELDTVVGRHRMVEESDFADLIYLNAVLKETLRLHPPAPLLLPHMSTEACTVAGYTLPKGTRLFVNAWAIGRDPERWEEPENFMPERFIGKKMDVGGQDFEVLAFGAGRRSCPGSQLAMVTMQTILANFVQCFDWELPLMQAVDMTDGVLAIPKPRLRQHQMPSGQEDLNY